MKWIYGRDLLDALKILPYELFQFVESGLPMYYVTGFPMQRTCSIDKELKLTYGYMVSPHQGFILEDVIRNIGSFLFNFKEVKSYIEKHRPDILCELASVQNAPRHDELDHAQQVGIPQLDPPELLPNEPKDYNEQLIQRGFNDEAARAYMIRNAKGKWGRITNYAALAIATGQPLPARNDQAYKDRLNSQYTERVHYGLMGKPRPKKKKASKKD